MPAPDSDSRTSPPAKVFATTHWSVVLRAGSRETVQSRDALERLCEAYWYPLFAHARRRGWSVQDAEDLVQGFLCDLFQKRPFDRVSPERGRFRSFLLASLNHFMAGEWDRRNALKRGGGRSIVSMDTMVGEQLLSAEVGAEASPEVDFDRRWAWSVLERALEALGLEASAKGKEALFQRLKPFLTDSTAAADYAALSGETGLSANALAAAVKRLRGRFRALVRQEIAQTVSKSSDVETEMAHLLEAMRG